MSPTISRWSSLVFFSVLLHSSHAYLFPLSQKKLHLDLFFFSICSASNLLQILQLIPCKSLWDLTSLVRWSDKCFLCDELGFTDLLFSVQPDPIGTTEAYHSVPPISQQEKQFATYSVFLLIQLHSMNLVLHKHHIFIIALFCISRTKPIRQTPEDPSWKLMSKGERKNTKAYHLEIEREREHQNLSPFFLRERETF